MSGILDRIAAGQDVVGIKLTGPDGAVKDHKLVSNEGEVTLTNEFLISREFTSSHDFSKWVEEHHARTGIPRMEIVIDYCQTREIDIESISPLINKVLKERIRYEAEQARLMKPIGRLPL
jgi:hypothetical protein